jgi:hypothetical protein
MNQLILTRRQILKAAGAAGGLVAASSLLGPAISLAGLDERGHAPLGPFGDWTPPVPIDEIASAADDYHPAISADSRSLYFTSTRNAISTPFPVEIMVIERPGPEGPWDIETLRPVRALSLETYTAAVPNLTPDGLSIYFQSKRPGGAAASIFSNLWVSHRDDPQDNDGWGTPTVVLGGINKLGYSNSAATYFRDPLTGNVQMYVSRVKGKGHSGQADEDFNISVTDANAAGFDEGVLVDSLNSPYGSPWSRDTRTSIRRDGLEMFVTTNRPVEVSTTGQPLGTPTENVWVMTRSDTASQNWQNPQPAPGLNSGLFDGGPALSWDARTIYFFSQRTTGKRRQVWMSTRRPVDD